MTNFNVYAIGNALLDIEYHSTEEQLAELSIDKGVMTLIDENQQHALMQKLGETHEAVASGGSAANTIIALCDFGGTASFSCRVASDASGQQFLQGLKDSQVASNAGEHLIDGVTGKCLVFVTPDADRTMNTFLGVSAMLDESVVDEQAIKQADYVYIEGYLVTGDKTREAAIKARDLAEKNNIKTALTLSDPAMVQFFKQGILSMLGEGVDLLFANEEEAMQLTGAENFAAMTESLKEYCNSYVVTRGAEGAYVYDGSDGITIAAHKVNAIDTLGAGDSFAGAFLYGITHNMNYEQAGKLASLTASKIVTQYGPRLSKSAINAVLDQYNAGN